MSSVLVRPCRRQLYSTGCSQGMAKGVLGTAVNFCDFSEAAGGHGISMILTFCSWDPRVVFHQDNNKKHCESYILKLLQLAQCASHGLGDIRNTNHCVSTCTAQHKIFLFTKHSTVHDLTICCYEQQEGSMVPTWKSPWKS